jgi:hypothetical protein
MPTNRPVPDCDGRDGRPRRPRQNGPRLGRGRRPPRRRQQPRPSGRPSSTQLVGASGGCGVLAGASGGCLSVGVMLVGVCAGASRVCGGGHAVGGLAGVSLAGGGAGAGCGLCHGGVPLSWWWSARGACGAGAGDPMTLVCATRGGFALPESGGLGRSGPTGTTGRQNAPDLVGYRDISRGVGRGASGAGGVFLILPAVARVVIP